MKKVSFYLLLFCLISFLPINARVITPMEAQTTAINLVDDLDGYGSALFTQVVLKKYSNIDESTPVLYVINSYDRSFTRGRFVILETISGTVLAYGDGLLDVDNIPEAMQLLLDYYQEQIDYLLANNMSPGGTSTSIRSTHHEVRPLITTAWGQGEPYNLMCPWDSIAGKRCLTGCGATAMAQVMNKWHCPQGTVDAIPGYISGNIVVEDLPETQFDWENMLDTYTGRHTAVQDTAVARLMRYVGQALETTYSASSSSSLPSMDTVALNRFGYNGSFWMRSKTDSVTWSEKMLSELESGRPIIYYAGAQEEGGGAHSFIVDGCKIDDDLVMFHINWGWSRNGNGEFYVLDNFTGSNHVWNVNQQMVVDIIPLDSLPPEVNVDSTALSFEEFMGYTQEKSFMLRGNWLKQNIELSISGDEAFELSEATPTTITPNQAAQGVKVTVRYSPTWETSRESSAVVNINSEVGLMTVDLSGKAIMSETYIDIDNGVFTFNDGHTGYAQTTTFNVMARIYYLKDNDTTVYDMPLRNNITLNLYSQDDSCPFKIKPKIITPQQAYDGFPVTVTYNPQADGESTADIILSTPGSFEDQIVNLYGKANSNPCIRVSEPTLSFNNWHTGYETTKTVIVSAYHTSGDVELSLDNPSGYFTISPTVIPADSAGKGMPVTVAYYPQEDGQHSATLTLTNPTANAVTRNISGNADSAPCIEVDSTSLSFEEYTGYTQTKTIAVKAYNLNDDVILNKTGRGSSGVHRFTVTPSIISASDAEQGATVSIEYNAAGVTAHNQTIYDHSAQVEFLCSDENLNELSLEGHSIKSEYYISANDSSLSFNTTVGQPVSTSINLIVKNSNSSSGGGDDSGVIRNSWDGEGEGNNMSNCQLNWRPTPYYLSTDWILYRIFNKYAIIDGDDDFELDEETVYYKDLDKYVYVLGSQTLPFSGETSDSVSVIFNPKNSKQSIRNATITFYVPEARPLTVSLTGIVEIDPRRGDVNGDGEVNIADVTTLIDYLLSHDANGISLENANCNLDDDVNIADVTALIDYLLSGSW